MAKVTITHLNRSVEEPVRRTVLKKRKGVDDKGAVRLMYCIDASGEAFDVEFTKAFRLSVAQARKENKSVARRVGKHAK